MDTGDDLPVGGQDGTEGSSAQFVEDLRELRRREGNLGYKTLARRMGLSHGSLHAALKDPPRLPSEYVLTKMISYWSPEDLQLWLIRYRGLRNLDGSLEVEDSTSSGGGTQPSDPIKELPSRRWRSWLTGGLAAVAVAAIGVAVATPIPVGGIDVVEYCKSNYARTDAGPVGRGDGTWSGWVCLTDDGAAHPVDMNRACKQQRPPLSPFGRTFADHVNDGAVSWRCYSSPLYLGVNDH